MNKLCFEELDCFIDASLNVRPTIENLKEFDFSPTYICNNVRELHTLLTKYGDIK